MEKVLIMVAQMKDVYVIGKMEEELDGLKLIKVMKCDEIIFY